MANDNFRMVPAGQLPTIGRIVGDGEVRLDQTSTFDRHCIANDLNPSAWRAAVRETQARWRRAGAASGVEKAPRS